MSRLNEAIRIAAELHDGQVDKSGEPYIFHPLRVMMAVKTEPQRVVAVLHDVAEDHEEGWMVITDWCDDQDIIDAIDAVTRRNDETYEAFIIRAKQNEIARVVKIADIEDNLSPSRREGLTPKLENRYWLARDVLSGGEK